MNKTIVVIDDDRINNFICENLVKEYDPEMRVETFIDSEEGFKFLLKERENIAYLLLDLNMPVYDGWSILEMLKNIEISIPTVILTSSISIDDSDKTKQYASVAGFINKPASLDKLRLYFEKSGI
ncbi:MAG: response regulator [Bacteroidota bacterium]|nr:response regulator [Bacteroidota bacterium]